MKKWRMDDVQKVNNCTAVTGMNLLSCYPVSEEALNGLVSHTGGPNKCLQDHALRVNSKLNEPQSLLCGTCTP
jgi:hypothetical protein